VVIGTGCIGSSKSNYHTITARTFPNKKEIWNKTYPCPFRFYYNKTDHHDIVESGVKHHKTNQPTKSYVFEIKHNINSPFSVA
jgi:hypothetical protein